MSWRASGGRGSARASFLVCLLSVLPALAPSTASAAQVHAFATSFGSSGAAAGQLDLQPFKGAAAGSGVAVSAANGDVYVADSGNHRIDEFNPSGTFVRAFGWEVNAEHPEAKLQTCTEATGCQAGSSGSSPGQLGAPNYLAIDNDPLSPSFGDLYVADGVQVEYGVNEIQEVSVTATGGTFTLSFEGQTTTPLPFNADRRELEVALAKLPAIGPGNAFAWSLPHARISFERDLREADLPALEPNGSGLTGPGATVTVTTARNGRPFAPEVITKFDPEGHLVEAWGKQGQLDESPPLATATGLIANGSAIGLGNITAGSKTVSNVSAEDGTFEVGQGIEGEGIPFATYVTAVGAGAITLSHAANGTASGVALTANNRFVTNLKPETGELEVFQAVSGAGISPGTRIEEAGSGFIVLSRSPTSGGSVGLTANLPLSNLAGVALYRNGDLLTSEAFGGRRSLRFDAGGSLIGYFATEEDDAVSPVGLAVDSAGNIFDGFSNSQHESAVNKHGPSGELLGRVFVGVSLAETAFALDPATADIYVDQGTLVRQVSHRCEPSPAAGCAASEEFGVGHLSEGAGIGVGPNGSVYVADAGQNRIAVFRVSLEADISAATEVKAKSAVLHGMVNAHGGEVVSCSFQVGPNTSYGSRTACLNEAGEEIGTAANPITGNAPVAVQGEAGGLKAARSYHFRLRAVNGGKEEVHSEDEELETLVLPQIEAAEATEVAADSATLKADINPQGPAVTSCQVEWGTSTAYGNSVPCEPATLPAGASPVPVTAIVNGLETETTYHWRLVVSDENGTETSPDSTFVFLPGPVSGEVNQDCANESLREENGSMGLPDCRAYEQVTPAAKNGALIGSYFFASIPVLSTPARDGSRVISVSTQCFAESQSCNATRETTATDFEFARSGSGWQPTPLTPPNSEFVASVPFVVHADQGNEIFSVVPRTPPEGDAPEWLYARNVEGELKPIGPVAEGKAFGRYETSSVSQAATADLSHVIYGGQSLWPTFDGTGRPSLFEYSGAAAHPNLVGVTGGTGSTDLISRCGTDMGDGRTGRALSADGTTVYFTVAPCAGGTGPNSSLEVPSPALYARIDGESGDARTVKISGPGAPSQCDSACQANPPAAARFITSSEDGSRAFFLSTGQLTDEASEDRSPTDSAEGTGCWDTRGKGGCNLYLYENPQQDPLTGAHLVDVSAGDTSGQGPQVQGVMAVAGDGSRVYFVAKGSLAGANAEGVEPTEGGDNLYVYDVPEAATRFVATLPDDPVEPGDIIEEREQWGRNPNLANFTAGGRFLTFFSHGALTPDVSRENGPEQVYRYDAVAERLIRISIGRKGFNADGNKGSGDARIVNSNQSISADGSRIFFESPVGLTPGALDDVSVNNRGQLAENIYEWEEEGVGGCSEQTGCVYLISDGKDVAEGPSGKASTVSLIGTDASGGDVFFATADQLVPGDRDTAIDIYDARVGGGFSSPPSVPCESSEQCHAGATQEAASSGPSTSGFSGPEEGPGHPRRQRAPCKKGFVRRHGHCVKKHPKHGKKHHARKGRS